MIKKVSSKRKKELAEYSKTMDGLKNTISCQRCAYWLNLEHHHIIFRSEAPKHENLHNPRNVIKLCGTCHKWFHNKKDNRKELVIERKLWELFPELRLKERYTN